MRHQLRAVANDHGITRACQGYFRAALLKISSFLGGVALDHQVHRAAQAEMIKVAFQGVILRSAINRVFGDILVFCTAEYQNRNMWRGGPQLFKSRHTPSVWHFDVYNDPRTLPLWMRATPSDSFLTHSTCRPSLTSFFNAFVIKRASAGWHSINSSTP